MWTWLENQEVRRRTRRADDTAAGPRPRPELPPGTDLLPQIRHIVVLMMENHSYDNYLGMLTGRGDGFPLDAGGTPGVTNPRRDGSPVRAFRQRSCQQVPHVPSQSWRACHQQWNNGANDGFVRSVEESSPAADPAVAMGYWAEEDLPFYYALARTFPLADRWFCSCLGPTFPNRRFLIAGTANGLVDDLPFDLFDYPRGGTIFDSLAKYGVSWANYHHVTKYKIMFRRALGGGGLATARRVLRLGHLASPVVRAMRGNKSFTADLYPLGLARAANHLHPIGRFFADAAAGTLPAFSIVDPDFSAFSEENPQDIRRGESFAAQVINAVMHGKAMPHTLLIWLYDEHGGYYDHVPPPAAVPPDDIDGRPLRGLPGWLHAALRPVFRRAITGAERESAGPHRYDCYGFRVPAAVVSPYARPGYVSSQVFDHTSVLKLVERKWNLPPLTRRDAAAAAPLDMLDLDGPPAFLDPPDLPDPAVPWESPRAGRRHRLRGRGGAAATVSGKPTR